MTDVNEQLKKLAFKTPRKYVKKDPKGNSYITARYVMNALDTLVGPANWHDEYTVIDRILRDDGTARITVECKLTVLGVTKVDVGFGEILRSEKVIAGTGEVKVTLYGNYEKEAYSIALKRAAVKFGIGRDLYEDGMPNYETEPEAPETELDEAEPEPEQKPAPPKASKPKPKPASPKPPPPWNENKPAEANADAELPDLSKRMCDLDYPELGLLATNGPIYTGLNEFHFKGRMNKRFPEAKGNFKAIGTITVGEFLDSMKDDEAAPEADVA